MAADSDVTIRVLPFTAPRHPGVDGAFTLLDVEVGAFVVAVVESLDRSVFLEEAGEINRCTMVFDKACELGLSAPESRALIERVLRES